MSNKLETFETIAFCVNMSAVMDCQLDEKLTRCFHSRSDSCKQTCEAIRVASAGYVKHLERSGTSQDSESDSALLGLYLVCGGFLIYQTADSYSIITTATTNTFMNFE